MNMERPEKDLPKIEPGGDHLLAGVYRPEHSNVARAGDLMSAERMAQLSESVTQESIMSKVTAALKAGFGDEVRDIFNKLA